jgi:hypothetical protein
VWGVGVTSNASLIFLTLFSFFAYDHAPFHRNAVSADAPGQ